MLPQRVEFVKYRYRKRVEAAIELSQQEINGKNVSVYEKKG